MIMLIIIVTLMLISIAYSIYPSIRTLWRMYYYLSKIPGPPGSPIIGNIYEFLTEPEQIWTIFRSMKDKYYPIYKLWYGVYAIVNVLHPDDAKIVLSSQKNISKSFIYNSSHDWFGTGLLTSTGYKWRSRRKILTPAFHFNVLREFADIFDKEGHRMVRDLKSQNDSITVDLVSFTTKYTLNAICETAMGTSLASMEASHNNFHAIYRKAVHDLGNLIIYSARPWLYPKFIFLLSFTSRLQNKCLKVIRGFSKKIIKERQKYHEDTDGIHLKQLDNKSNKGVAMMSLRSSKKKLAMLDLLIAAMKDGYIDHDGIWEEVDTFMFEGHDTTAMGITFTLLLLAKHTDIQQRARDEIDEILKNCGGHMGLMELQQLPYLERCIKEALRLYPSVPLISRDITDDMILRNYMIPAGSIVHVHIYDVHRDPNFWPDPHRYDPDRFLPERIQGHHPFSYIPFSSGLRNCIGQKFGMMELKTMIGHLIHNFYLESIDIASDVRIMTDLVLRPTSSTRIKFIPRYKLNGNNC